MTVIVDTNVLLSAVIRDRLPQRVIEEIASRDDCFWIVTPEIVRECCEILSRPKFNIADSTRQRWIVFLDAATTRFETSARPPSFLRDPKDALFLAAALASEADYLITGDKDFTEAQSLITSRIVTVSEFARFFDIQ